MTAFKLRAWLKIVSALIIILFGFGFTSKQNSQFIIHRGNIYYLANTVVVKFKSNPTTGMLKAQSVTAMLNKALGKFNFTSAKTIFGSSPAEVKFGLNRIMEIHFSGQGDPLYAAAKIKELNNEPGSDAKLLAFCIFIMLKEQVPYLTEEEVLKNIPADVDTLEVLAKLGFINPSKLEQANKIREALIKKSTGEESSSG